MTDKLRERRAMSLLKSGAVKQLSSSLYAVKSQKHDMSYEVAWSRSRWACTCPDFHKSKKRCKHVYAVIYYQMTRDLVQASTDLYSPVDNACPKCGSPVIKKGFRYDRSGPVQRLKCKKCGHRFTLHPLGALRNRAEVVMAALDLHFRGLSLRQTCEHLEAYWNCKVSYTTIMRWIRKFVRIANESFGSVKGLKTERWNADETLIRVGKKHVTVWSLLDERTRFLISLRISDQRTGKDAKALFKDALRRAGPPLEVVSDGAPVYSQAMREMTAPNRSIIHVEGTGLTSGMNNKIERYHRTLKTRVRANGGFRTKQGADAFGTGYKLFYNYMKPHRALKGRTPAEAVGLTRTKQSWKSILGKSSGSP